LNITKDYLIQIREKPHKLGLLVGKSKLTDQHSIWMHHIWNNLHTSLQAHRGSYKTTAIVIIGCPAWLLFNPNYRIAIIRKNFTDASACLRNISDIMKREEVREIFKFAHGFYPRAKIDRADKLEFNFKDTTTPEGSIDAHGIKSSITGSHYDFILCDDFVTILDKISKAEREKTKMMLEELKVNVLDPGMGAGFIGTPWHKDDAWGMCPEPLKKDVYQTGILSPEEIQKKKDMTTHITWAANYELRHATNANAIFKNATYGKWDYRIKTGIGHLDAAYKGKDTTALTFLAKKKDGRFQGIGFVFTEDVRERKNFIKEKWKKYFIGTVYNEENADKGFLADSLSEKGVQMSTYHESMNKHVKIIAYGKENGFWDKIDWDPDTDPEYLNQILDYVEGSEPDDAPDSFACLGRIIVGDSVYDSLYS